ncbi:MAG TPA: MBL fold metallo-hydrolase [Acidimicrobiales bacterium]|nr:MBL fold metallo-hydrolase [Acidimicrobiales bacterium]
MSAPTSHGHPDDAELGPPETVEVGDGLFAYVQPDGSWWINNTGFLVDDDRVVAIDTCSTERRTRGFLEAIAAVTPRPVRTLINTHHHGDHTNGNSLVAGEATIIGHHVTRDEVLRTRIGGLDAVFGPVEWGELTPAAPTVTFSERLDVHVAGRRVELIHFPDPAHTRSDVVAWLAEERVLYAGDLVFNGGTPFVVMGSVAGSLAAVRELRTLHPQVIVPGHGGVCGIEVLDRVEAYLGFVSELAASAKAAGESPLDAARQADLGEFASLLDPERIVGNLHRAYAELDGREPDVLAAFGDMIAYNGGKPLRCLA